MVHPADFMDVHACIRVLLKYKFINEKDRDHIIFCINYAHDHAVQDANRATGLNWNQRKLPYFESKSDEDEWMKKWYMAYWESVDRQVPA